MQLAAIANEHPRELNAHLICYGLRLRDVGPRGDFTYEDLDSLVLAAPMGSHLWAALSDDETWRGWTRDAMLLADAVDALNILIWQKTKDGQNGRKPPKPVPRPGVKDENREVITHKGHAVSIEEAQARTERSITS